MFVRAAKPRVSVSGRHAALYSIAGCKLQAVCQCMQGDQHAYK